MDNKVKQALVGKVPFWWHSIDLGDGVITPGYKTPNIHKHELEAMRLPDLRGKSVLDIGAWDGFYSFEAERRGARRVLALDHYIWSLDITAQQAYGSRCINEGTPMSQYHLVPGLWHPGTLPGKLGFDTAHAILNSRVESMAADFSTVEPLAVGSFDIVFFLGLLYHLPNPFDALKRLALFTREIAIIETQAIYVRDFESKALFEFYEGSELAYDVNNWWAPNLTGLTKACRAAGFRGVEPTSLYAPDSRTESSSYRLTVQAWR